jgi:hypothetical protein
MQVLIAALALASSVDLRRDYEVTVVAAEEPNAAIGQLVFLTAPPPPPHFKAPHYGRFVPNSAVRPGAWDTDRLAQRCRLWDPTGDPATGKGARARYMEALDAATGKSRECQRFDRT